MKNLKQLIDLKSSKIYARLLSKLKAVNGMIRRNSGRPMINILKKVSIFGGIPLNKGLIKVICTFVFACSKLYNTAGPRFLVIYLKACFVLTQQSAGGHILRNSFLLGCGVARNRSGLPLMIPALHRQAIRNGNPLVLRFWLTLFSLYRVIEFKGKPNLDSITDPGSMKQEIYDEFKLVAPMILRSLQNLVGRVRPIRFNVLSGKPFLISSSTPVVGSKHRNEEVSTSILSTSPVAIIRAAHLLHESELWPVYRKYCSKTKNIWAINRLETIVANTRLKIDLDFVGISKKKSLGALGFKDESAGKVRIFAMVDCWTQWVLSPLMGQLSKLLENIPQDGTNNQLAPLSRILRNFPKGPFYCYDLKSATDRIPVSLQEVILGLIIGQELANLWRKLLVDRTYKAYSQTYSINTCLTYAVGQPMGAKSSFHMMGLFHHFLVQWAAIRAKTTLISISGIKDWFSAYAIVGDDIVIADEAVAKAYLILCSQIGIQVGLAKSLVSPRGLALEFVKRTYFRGHDVSAVPISEFWIARQMLPAALEFAKKYKLSLSRYLDLNDFGYKVKGSLAKPLRLLGDRARDRIVMFLSPYGPGKLQLIPWLSLKSATGLAYTWTDGKARAALIALLTQERTVILDRLIRLEIAGRSLWTYITVKRDREWYGIVRHAGDRRTDFPNIIMREISEKWNLVVTEDNISYSLPMDVGPEKAQYAFDVIKELVYREPFLDTVIQIRDLKLKIEDPAEAVLRGLMSPTDRIDFSSVWLEIDNLEKTIGSLTVHKELYSRVDPVSRQTTSRMVKMWKAFSPFARSTRSTSKK